MKSIINLKYYIADCVSWVTRLTVGLTKLDLRVYSQNRTLRTAYSQNNSCVGDLMHAEDTFQHHKFQINIAESSINLEPKKPWA